MAELDELIEINSELDTQTGILQDIYLDLGSLYILLQSVETDTGNIDLKLFDTNLYLENQELRNDEIDEEITVSDFHDYINSIDNRATDITLMGSYNFIFFGVIVGLLIVNFFAVLFRKI